MMGLFAYVAVSVLEPRRAARLDRGAVIASFPSGCSVYSLGIGALLRLLGQ